MSNVMDPQSHERKYKLLALGLIIAAVACIGLIAFTLLTKNTNDEKKKAETSATVADVTGQGELQGNEQRGKGKIENDCYSFEVPRSVSLGENQFCEVDLGYGSSEANVLTVGVFQMVRDETGRLNFTKSLESYKKQLQANGEVVDSEQLLKLDGQEAARITTTRQNQKKILVIAQSSSSDRLDSSGDAIEGILISTPNFTKEQSEVIEGVVETWKWR